MKKKATSGPSQSDDNDENVEGKLKIERRTAQVGSY